MDNKNYRLTALALLTMACMGMSSCTSANQNQNGDTQDIQNEEFQEQTTFYLVPSPEDLFAFNSDNKFEYQASLLNSTENAEKYIDTRSKEFNFGVYSADMAYAAAFGKYQESVKYLQQVRKLSEDIGIAGVFTEKLVERIEKVDNNRDSLKNVSGQVYKDIVEFLRNNEKNTSEVLISAGGWMECLYIVTNSITEFKEGDENIQTVADQKVVFTNLINGLEQFQSDASVAQTLNDFNAIKQVYDKLQTEPQESKVVNSEAIKIGGNAKLVITKEQFEELKKTICEVRNKLTQNSVN